MHGCKSGCLSVILSRLAHGSTGFAVGATGVLARAPCGRFALNPPRCATSVAVAATARGVLVLESVTFDAARPGRQHAVSALERLNGRRKMPRHEGAVPPGSERMIGGRLHLEVGVGQRPLARQRRPGGGFVVPAKDSDGNYLATCQAAGTRRRRAASGRSWQIYIDHCPKRRAGRGGMQGHAGKALVAEGPAVPEGGPRPGILGR